TRCVLGNPLTCGHVVTGEPAGWNTTEWLRRGHGVATTVALRCCTHHVVRRDGPDTANAAREKRFSRGSPTALCGRSSWPRKRLGCSTTTTSAPSTSSWV